MSGPVDVLVARAQEILRERCTDGAPIEREDLAIRIARLEQRDAAVAELIEADQRAIERMERVLEAAADLNKLLPEAQPIRDQLSTVVGQTSLAIEAKRAALARVKGVQP